MRGRMELRNAREIAPRDPEVTVQQRRVPDGNRRSARVDVAGGWRHGVAGDAALVEVAVAVDRAPAAQGNVGEVGPRDEGVGPVSVTIVLTLECEDGTRNGKASDLLRDAGARARGCWLTAPLMPDAILCAHVEPRQTLAAGSRGSACS